MQRQDDPFGSTAVGVITPEAPVDAPAPPSVPKGHQRRRRLILVGAGALVVLLVAGAILAHLSLSQTYSAQRAVEDYFAAQARSDVTGNNVDAMDGSPELRARRAKMWHDWLRRRFADNVPYDQTVRGILCATSRDGLPPEEWLQRVKEIDAQADKGFATSYAERASLDLFWRRQARVPIEQWGEKTAAAFMGIRLECAQCQHRADARVR